MPDEQTKFLLQRITELCADGNYKVVEREDLLSALPSGMQEGDLDGMLSALQAQEYVDIKYADRARGVYCLFPLPSGRNYAERLREKRFEEEEKTRRSLLVSFFGAFAGGALGAGMVALICLFFV